MTTPARILFVDDEPEVLASLADHWGLDFEVETASSGAAGLEAVARWQPDLVISDMRMPGMDGATFLGKVRALAPDVMRLLLTGHADVDAAMRAVNHSGVYRFLLKPCSHDDMAAAIDDALAERRASQAERGRVAALTSGIQHTERLATLGTITATLGHELNNSLSLMRLAIDDIVEDSACHQAPSPDAVRTLVAGRDRLLAQSAGALRLSRRSRREPVALAIVALVEEVVAALRAAGVLRLVEVELAVTAPPDARVVADRTELEQVLVNLVKNATDAMSGRRARTLRVAVAQVGAAVEVRVADTGCGISSEQLARVFEPYFTTKAPGVGTGLGLPVVKQLVESFHGSVAIASEVDRGTEVTVVLPVAA